MAQDLSHRAQTRRLVEAARGDLRRSHLRHQTLASALLIAAGMACCAVAIGAGLAALAINAGWL